MKTASEIKMKFGKGGLLADITIPAGTRVVACGDASEQFFVDDLTWLDRKTQGMSLHDATYYGIRLNKDQVCE